MFLLRPSRVGPILIVTASALVVAISGCDSGPKMASVTGRVTFNGKAVPEGTITFYPSAGGRPSTGQIQSDGSYELSSIQPGDGAVLGAHKVAVESRRVTNAPPEPKTFEEELASEHAPPPRTAAKIEWHVPQQYSSAETSGLTATVEDKTNIFDFSLP